MSAIPLEKKIRDIGIISMKELRSRLVRNRSIITIWLIEDSWIHIAHIDHITQLHYLKSSQEMWIPLAYQEGDGRRVENSTAVMIRATQHIW